MKPENDISLLLSVFPHLSEYLRIAQLCKAVGLAIYTIKLLFKGEVVSITGKLHLPEHDQSFDVQSAKLQLFKEQDNPDKLKLSINGQNIIYWFTQKCQELKQSTRLHIKSPAKPEVGKNKGFKL